MNAVALPQFLRDHTSHFSDEGQIVGGIEIGLPRLHYEVHDSWTTVTSCLSWRGEIRLVALDMHARTPEIIAGFVDFIVLRLGYQPVEDVLEVHGSRAVPFLELFRGAWLEPTLEKNDAFTAGPINAVMLVLEARVDELIPDRGLRAWAVSEVISTMLPTTSGLVVMSALPPGVPSGHIRRLIPVDRIDADWPLVGCIPVPSHPRFYGRATASIDLDEARYALGDVRRETVRVPVDAHHLQEGDTATR